MAQSVWGSLEDSEGYGRLEEDKGDYLLISKEESLLKTQYKHASHGMIYAKKSTLLWDLYETRAMVMMQMRFDGVLGFPGGLVDDGETPLEGINREMKEEIGLDLTKYNFTNEHHVASFVHEPKKLVLHFYIMDVTPEDFVSVEKNSLAAKEYGEETFGAIRVPLFTMGDGLRGFPAFLANQFAGNARSELLEGLQATKLFTEEEIHVALKSCKEFLCKTKCVS